MPDLSKLTEADRAIFGEVIPLVQEIEERLDAKIDLSLWAVLTRRLAVDEFPLERLQTMLPQLYEHQRSYELRKH